MVNYPIHERIILKYKEEFDAKYSPFSNIFVSAMPILMQKIDELQRKCAIYSSQFLTMSRNMLSSHHVLPKVRTCDKDTSQKQQSLFRPFMSLKEPQKFVCLTLQHLAIGIS